jgi:two-component system sensor histidine kinase/response regulator
MGHRIPDPREAARHVTLVPPAGGAPATPTPRSLSSITGLVDPLVTASADTTGQMQRMGKAACSLRVLLAEDNPVTQKLATSLLTMRGHEVTAVENGMQAVEAWRRTPFDVVLMDIHMPEMDGLTATAVIRDLEKSLGRRTPIVAMTARVLRGDREQCLAAGMDAYVAKPISPAALFITMEPLATMDTAPVDDASGVDMQELLSIVHGDRKLLGEIIELFLDDAQTQITKIASAIGRGDALSLRMSAHALKGSAGSVRVNRIAAIAAQLESAARSGDLAGADETLAELQFAFNMAQGTLDPMMRAW